MIATIYRQRQYTQEENILIEDAIYFLTDEYRKSGINPKPVVFHSIRVASLLVSLGESSTVITASLLHDLVEDSSVDIHKIISKFGNEIASLVSALSFDTKIINKKDQYEDMFQRVTLQGRDALVIKAADIIDNSVYYNLSSNNDSKKNLVQKMQSFLDICRLELSEHPITRLLEQRCLEVIKELA
jgi:(p)ppGpp synthase/HD superfamily hydrolase